MKFILLLMLTSTQIFANTASAAEYPNIPDRTLTPGSLCDQPDSYRYPEKIPYCERDHLEQEVKEQVMQNYRRKGYRLDPNQRSSYKIDHMIPLCAGGSNNSNNLWPQHKNIYVITDPIEPVACKKLAAGRISQSDLVRLIIVAKTDLRRAQEILAYLQSL